MHQRTRLHAFAVMSCLALGLAAQAQEPAAKPETTAAQASSEPVKVAPHASRWDYPKEVTPPAGHTVHIVVRGDTLWDLGASYLGNPFSWPQIWELNKWVKDPHWIYPGDPLVIDGSRKAVKQGQEEEATPSEVTNLRPDLHRFTKPVQREYGYSFQDFIQLPYLAPKGAAALYREKGGFLIRGHQDGSRGILSDGDSLYFAGGTNQGVKVGDRLVVTKLVRKNLYHPDDTHQTRSMGDVLQQEGIVRVVTVYDNDCVAVIEHCLDGIYEGSYALPFTEPASIVANLRRDIGNPVDLKTPTAKIVFIRDGRSTAAGGDLVIIDQGSAHGLKVGDLLLMARQRPLDTLDNPEAMSGYTLTGELKTGKKVPLTNYYLGQMMVVRTDETSATCRILRTKEEIFIGDVVTR